MLRSQRILFISDRTIWRYCSCAQTLPLPYIKCGRSPSLCNTVNYRLQSRSCGEGTEGHLGLRVQCSRQSWPFHEPRFLSAGAPHARTAALPPVSRGRRARIHRGRMEPPGGRAGGRRRARAPGAAVRPLLSAARGSTAVPSGSANAKMEASGREGDAASGAGRQRCSAEGEGGVRGAGGDPPPPARGPADLPGCCSSRLRWPPPPAAAPRSAPPRRRRREGAARPAPGSAAAAAPSAPARRGGTCRWPPGISCPCSTAPLRS